MSVLEVGRTLETASGSRIEVLDLIQRGGQASVWKVREVIPGGRTLAAKLVTGKFSERGSKSFSKVLSDIENEVAILNELKHRFIANYLYSVSHVDMDSDCIVSGFVMHMSPIGTVRDLLRDRDFTPVESLKEAEKSTLIRRIAQAVATTHNRGIIHSDLKAENVLIHLEDGLILPSLIDFGGSFHVHQPWRGMRTERYSAPELQAGSAATIQSDIYALGVLVSEILAGERLFQPSPEALDRVKVTTESAASYLGLVRRMLSSDPMKRPDPNTISRAFLTRESEQTLIAGSSDREISFPTGKFHWHPQIHLSYGGLKVLAFLKSSNPTSDARLLRRVLDRFRFYGSSIHRVFGRADFYVECWITDDRLQRFKDALAQFQGEQPHHHYDVAVEIYEIVQLVAEKAVPAGKMEDLIGMIHERFDVGDTPNQVDRYIIRENDPDNDDIRFVLTMSPRNPLDGRQIQLIVDLIKGYLAECRHITPAQKTITRIMASSSSSKILVSVPVKKMRNYRDLMLGISQHLKRKMLVADDFVFDYSTLIDMDGNGFYDGRECFFRDDGMIPTRLREDFY